MNAYSKSEKGYNRQLATGYAVYMMCGSLFRESHCTNPCEESHLYLHYAGMPRQRQYDTEDEILLQLRQIREDWRLRLEELKCEVHFRREEDRYRILFFTGGFETVESVIEKDGSFQIDYSCGE